MTIRYCSKIFNPYKKKFIKEKISNSKFIMKRKPFFTTLFYILCFVSCNSSTSKVSVSETQKDSTTLQGTVPFEYDNFKKGIILDAIMNDTIHLKAFFDTGCYSLMLPSNFSKHETDKKTDTPFKLQIGNWFYEQPSIGYMNNQFLFDFE